MIVMKLSASLSPDRLELLQVFFALITESVRSCGGFSEKLIANLGKTNEDPGVLLMFEIEYNLHHFPFTKYDLKPKSTKCLVQGNLRQI